MPAAVRAPRRPSGDQEACPEELIERDVALDRYTSLRIGGPADQFARPRTVAEVAVLVQYARERGLPWMVLGNGTNILFPDEGYRGLILHLRRNFNARRLQADRLQVQAGAGLGEILGYLRARGFHDFDGLVGIPGTVGGALAMNAGTPETTVSQGLVAVTVLTDRGEVRTLAFEAGGFGYRTSLFRERGWVVLEGEFRVGGERRFDVNALMARRRRTQPLGRASPGCVFKNPGGGLTAGQLIERAGLKGLCRGDAMISPIHANFIVNRGRAKAADLLRLIDIAREKVYKQFGVELRLELVVVSN